LQHNVQHLEWNTFREMVHFHDFDNSRHLSVIPSLRILAPLADSLELKCYVPLILAYREATCISS
jgi:hypothetical protein